VASRPVTSQECFRFGDDFELDLRAYQLRSGGIPLKLKPIAMELLILLVEQRGVLVTREEIVERIWGRGVFLDTDNSINAAISKIRRALRDDIEQPRFVQTVSGKGYRFIAPVTEVFPPPARRERTSVNSGIHLEPVPAVATQAQVLSAVTRLRWGLLLATVGALIIAAAGMLALRSRVVPQATPGRLMLAVVPFQNLTGDPSQEYFSDGLTEEMITRLGNLDPRHFGVIARTSVMHYKNTTESVAEIGRQLNVQYVLEGSVRRDSQRVRITAQLIQVKDQTHLWARQYDRELGSLLALQAEIAQEIADQIQAGIGHQFKPPNYRSYPPSTNYEAYDLYLKGQYFWNKRTPEGFSKAATDFQEAIRQDPNYAQAYAGLADVYAMMSNYALVPANEYMPKARMAAMRALQIDDSLAEAHTSLAIIAENYDYDWQTAEKEYRRAIELNPNYSTARHWYAESLAFQGRFDEALAESETARQLDPLSLIIAADNGAILYFSGQYERAIERFRSVLEMDAGFTRAHLVIAAYVQKGQFENALADIENWQRVAGDAPWIAAWETYVYGREGKLREAQKSLQRVQQLSRKWQVDPAQFMILCYAGLNNKKELLAWLEKSAREHTNVPTGLKVDPLYDSLRSDRQFQDLLRRVGLTN
jgi:TolB-like protein/DNA-binding winged helix-turn-helix (wHTH) protein/Tfp pilus assembly protein PilF